MHEYQRLSTLHVEAKSIKDFNDFQPGDCIVAFSRKTVFQIKSAINKSRGKEDQNHCAVIYVRGSPYDRKGRPPAGDQEESGIHVQQQDGRHQVPRGDRCGKPLYPVTVAQVGMGLNLNIQRVIFSTITKTRRGQGPETLDAYTIKQIGGRAGRYTQDGLVNAFSQADLQEIRQCIGTRERKTSPQEQPESDDDDEEEGGAGDLEGLAEARKRPKKLNFTGEQQLIKQACLFPSFRLIEQFAQDLQLHEKVRSPLSRIIKK